MREFKDFTDIIETWGRKNLADDIGVPKERARQWSRDNSIAPKYWRLLLERAPKRGIELSPQVLIDIAAGR